MKKGGQAVVGVLIVIALAAGAFFMSGQNTTPESLRLGVLPLPVAATLYYADQQEVFQDNGLNVELVEYSNGFAALEGLAAGEVDVALGANIAILSFLQDNPERRDKIIANLSEANTMVLLTRHEELGDIERVGVLPKTVTEYFWDRYTILYPETTDVTKVEGSVPQSIEAFTTGAVDAAVLPIFAASKLAANDESARIVPVQEGRLIDTALLASEEMLANNDEALHRLLESVLEADKRFNNDAAQGLLEVAELLDIQPEGIDGVINTITYATHLNQSYAQSLLDVQEWVLEKSGSPVVVQGAFLEEVVEPGILHALDQDRVTIDIE